MRKHKDTWTWDYRIVNIQSENGGEPWYALQEVHYKNGVPMDYTAPCTGSNTPEGAAKVGKMIADAFNRPYLQETEISK